MADNTNTRSSRTSQKLRHLLADPTRIVVAPGVHDGISARIALSMGFDALYMVSTSGPKGRWLEE
jgi:2-methylisocitrate lyase-like PEP mutase family enzyme